MNLSKKILLICSVSFFLFTCKKDNNSNIPNTLVDIYIYTSNPSFVNLNAVGGWTYIQGGVRGILLYKKTTSEIEAYDRNCTYQPNNACATIYVDNTNIIAMDTCCHSKFSIYDGSATNGPASAPLKKYNTTFDGNVLHIYN